MFGGRERGAENTSTQLVTIGLVLTINIILQMWTLLLSCIAYHKSNRNIDTNTSLKNTFKLKGGGRLGGWVINKPLGVLLVSGD